MSSTGSASSEERFVNSFYDTIIDEELLDFKASELSEKTSHSPQIVSKNLNYLLENYEMPIEKYSKRGRIFYRVEDPERLDDVRSELEEDMEGNGIEEDILDQLKEKFGGEEVKELDLQLYLANELEGHQDDKRLKFHTTAAGRITEGLKEQDFVDYDPLDKTYSFEV